MDEFGPKLGVEPELIAAIILQESGGSQYAIRYEPKWVYWEKPAEISTVLKTSEASERLGQAISWGFMQVMGAVARELDFRGDFVELFYPSVNVQLGTAHLAKFIRKYPNVLDAIASYNAGAPRKDAGGRYANQGYVDGVLGFYRRVKDIPASR